VTKPHIRTEANRQTDRQTDEAANAEGLKNNIVAIRKIHTTLHDNWQLSAWISVDADVNVDLYVGVRPSAFAGCQSNFHTFMNLLSSLSCIFGVLAELNVWCLTASNYKTN